MKFVYLHGFASGPTSGKAQYFAKQFAARGVELEIPCLDNGDFENLTISGQLKVVEQAAGTGEVILMGSSMGGYLAALFAFRRPNVRRLVLLAPAFHFPHRWHQELGPERTAEWQRTGQMSVFHYGQGCEQNIRYTLLADAQLHDPAPSFEQPALLFHGSRDDIVPAEYSIEFAQRHPNVELHVLDSDHQLTDVVEVIWSRTERFLLG